MAQLFPSIIFLNGETLNTIEAEVYCVCQSQGCELEAFLIESEFEFEFTKNLQVRVRVRVL